VLIDGRILGHEGIYIGDSYQHFDISVGQAFRHFDLVEIARSVIVNRRPQEIPQIPYVRACGRLRRMCFQLGKLLRDLRRKFRLEAVLQHDFFSYGLKVNLRRMGAVHEFPARREL
jgi:hypothetical protein